MALWLGDVATGGCRWVS
jgi:hypothetical protein